MNKTKLKNTKITISGDLGSGKSVISKLLSIELCFDRISVGDIQRKLAEDHDMSTTEFNKYMETHPEIDEDLDQKISDLGTSDERIIFDSRMAWFFVPSAYKIHLTVDLKIAARRILNDKSRIGEKYLTLNEAIENIKARKASENLRFKEKYSVDCSNFYNLNPWHLNCHR